VIGPAVCLCAALAAAGCGQHDMVYQPKYKPLQPSSFFADGRASRPVEAGTVARGQLGISPAFDTGTIGGALVEYIPLKGFDPNESLADDVARPSRKVALERGRERFNIYCSPCHSRSGDGLGMIVQRGFPRPPSLHEKRLVDAPPGHFYHVITNGYGAMYSYAARVAPADRWAIVAYIKALQLSQTPKPELAAAGPALAPEKEARAR
jgi:mono/diheme cytochrome c family protein